MDEDCFSVDICFGEKWLVNALDAVRKDGICRVTVVIQDSGKDTKYKVRAIGGGEADFLRITSPGDITKESWYTGN